MVSMSPGCGEMGRPASCSTVPSAQDQRVAAERARLAAGQAVGRIGAAALREDRDVQLPEELEAADDAVAAALGALPPEPRRIENSRSRTG